MTGPADPDAVPGGPSPAARARGATVHLVAAGPGDPGLLTVRAERLLAAAEVVVCDRLLAPAVAALAGPAATWELVDDEHQAAAALVTHAGAGTAVVRLAAGDRLLWEAGGTEAAALRAAGHEAVVEPAVAAAFAIPASTGTPVMTRHLAAALTVAVGVDPPPSGRGTVVAVDGERATVAGAVAALDLRAPAGARAETAPPGPT